MTLRAVDIAGFDPVTPAPQLAPMLQWVQIADLVIDDRYQRPLGRANLAAIRRIAENFHWSRFTAVLVAPVAGGKFAVIDGQHRSHAALICGFDAVPCMVVPVAPEEQALAFAEVNSRAIRVSQHHIYKAALAAGEAWAERADLAVSRAGCRLMTYNPTAANKRAGEVYCIGLIRRLIDAGHAEVLTLCLSAIRASDDRGRVPLYTDYIIAPFVAAVASNPDFLALDLTAFLRRHDLFRLLEVAPPVGVSRSAAGRQAIIAALRRFEVTGVAA